MRKLARALPFSASGYLITLHLVRLLASAGPNTIPGNNLTYPQICPPTIDCQLTRLGSKYCAAQGQFEPELCAPGYYCPDPSQQIICPEGTYCIRGSSEPRPCPPMSICPEGTEIRRYYGGVVISLLLDFLILGLFLYLRYRYEPMLAAKRKAKHVSSLGGVAPKMLGLPENTNAEIFELREGLLSSDGGTGSSDGDYSALSDDAHGQKVPEQVYTANAKRIPEEGFRRSNAGLHLDLAFNDLGFTLPPPHSKTILCGVTGRIRPGRVTAVLGPSGAGKTTFLSVLMGKYQKTAGILQINGDEDEMQRYNRIVGFVPQDDTMIRELTVRENITFSARVRLPRYGWTDADIERHVDAVIEVLGLRECADTLSDHVSGGQRKRTNIGMELAMAPAAIFLDGESMLQNKHTHTTLATLNLTLISPTLLSVAEPTSGLDSTAALEVCKTLKAIADLGLTVVAVIHQPRYEIFLSFDDMLLLAPGGVTVYMGPQRGIIPYFEELGYSFAKSYNPADDLLDFVAGVPPHRPATTSAPLSATSMLRDESNASLSTLGGEDIGSGASSNLRMRSNVKKPASSPGGSSAASAAAAGAAVKGSAVARMLAEQWALRGPAFVAKIRGMNAASSSGADLSSLASAPSSSVVSENTVSIRTMGSLQQPPVSPGAAAYLGPADSSVLIHDGDGHSHGRFDPVMMTANRGATWWRQFVLCHNRSLLQQYRQMNSVALEMGVGLLAGGLMGAAATQVSELYVGILKPPYTLISPAPIETLLPSIGFYISLAVGLAGSPAGVRTFGEERQVYFREASSGHSISAYYVAKSVSVMYRFTLGALHFAALFHVLARPATPFEQMFLQVLLQYYCVYGLGAVTSMVVRRENSALLGVIASLVAGTMCGYAPNLTQGREWHVDFIQEISYARWGVEAWFHTESLPYRDLYMVEEISAPYFGYTLDRFGTDCAIILVIGFVLRAVAYVLLILLRRMNKDRR